MEIALSRVLTRKRSRRKDKAVTCHMEMERVEKIPSLSEEKVGADLSTAADRVDLWMRGKLMQQGSSDKVLGSDVSSDSGFATQV